LHDSNHEFYCTITLKVVSDKVYFLMTDDMERLSIPLNREDDNTAKEVYKAGLPRLLDLSARHDIKCTFYFTGVFAEQSSESVGLVKGE
jgi:peptidoglycan/xylan/chitin deacetylase (PgdA/CDA1 family)